MQPLGQHLGVLYRQQLGRGSHQLQTAVDEEVGGHGKEVAKEASLLCARIFSTDVLQLLASGTVEAKMAALR
jgi:hypothetical protein